MKTKDRIVEEALTLFSVKGFKGTSVKNIADAVGIKDSSLYKHFKSKQEIFDVIVLKMYERMGRLSEELGIPEGADIQAGEELRAAALFYQAMTLDALKELSRKVFLFYLTDEFVSRFWRLANMEQYQNPEIYEIFRRIFMEEGIAYQKQLFAVMMEKGIFVKADPEAVAMNFYAPIFFLLSKYNGRPEAPEEALEILNRQITEFYRLYRV